MTLDDACDSAASGWHTAQIVVRDEFGPLLAAAFPECEVTVAPGRTHVTAFVRDEAELFGVLGRLRDLGAVILGFTVEP